jgi:hypothetical protein
MAIGLLRRLVEFQRCFAAERGLDPQDEWPDGVCAEFAVRWEEESRLAVASALVEIVDCVGAMN